jgi:CMP-N-acetylneuraminic acid synthetase
MTARQDLPLAVIENGSIYVIKRSLIAENRIYGSSIVPYVMPLGNAVDIDTDDDLQWAQFLIAREQQ